MENFNVKITLENGENKELFYQFIPISHNLLGGDTYEVSIYDFKVFMPELIDRQDVTIKGSLERYLRMCTRKPITVNSSVFVYTSSIGTKILLILRRWRMVAEYIDRINVIGILLEKKYQSSSDKIEIAEVIRILNSAPTINIMEETNND